MSSNLKYQTLYRTLKQHLEAMSPGEKLPSIRTLRESYAVSLATLTAALKLLEEEGLIRTEPCRGLYKTVPEQSAPTSRTVTLLLPGRGECLFSKIISSSHEALYRRNCKLNLAVYQLDADSESALLREQLSDDAAGILYMPTFETPETVALMKELAEAKPLVQIDREIGDGAASAIGYRLFESSYQATELLIRQGCTRIGMIAPLENFPGQAERAAGFRAALRDYKLTENPAWHIRFNSQDPAISTDMTELLTGMNRPDAFFATNSSFSARLFQKFAQFGIRTPDDIRLTAFDLTETFAHLPLKITHVSEPTAEVCARAVELLLQMVETGERPVIREALPGQTIPGATCPAGAPPRIQTEQTTPKYA